MPLRALALAVLLTGCNGVARDLDKAHEFELKKDYATSAKLYQSALIDLGRDESATARAERAVALKALAHTYYLHIPDPAQAVRYYRDLAERYPEHPSTFEARANLADLLREKFHDRRAALAQLAALVQSFPNHLDT